jgi:hypothetical protein
VSDVEGVDTTETAEHVQVGAGPAAAVQNAEVRTQGGHVREAILQEPPKADKPEVGVLRPRRHSQPIDRVIHVG